MIANEALKSESVLVLAAILISTVPGRPGVVMRICFGLDPP